MVYLVLAAVLIARHRRSLRSLMRDGLFTSYDELTRHPRAHLVTAPA